MTSLLETDASHESLAGLDREELIGRVAALYLAERVREDGPPTGEDAGCARFIIDCLTPAQTAAIAREILADPTLAPRFEIRLPERFVAGMGLPDSVLTQERATYYRNAVSDRPALLLANTGDDEEQSLRDLASVGAGELQGQPTLWVDVASQGLPLSDDHRKWWARALAALQDLRFVSLDRYADYVLRTRSLIQEEGFFIIQALGAALPALRLPRDRCYFEAMPEAVRTHTSRWRTLFASIHSKRGSYLSKQTPSGGVLSEDDLRAAFARVAESIPDEVHPVVETFLSAPAGWTTASAALAECEWETVKPLFDGLRRERFNLGQATLDFFAEGNPELLSDAEREYLQRLIGRRTSTAELEEDHAFYNAHRDEMRGERKLKSVWDRFIFGTPRESRDFVAGLLACLEGLPWETPATRRQLTVRADRRFRRDLRDLNADAGLFFAHRYRGLSQLLGRGVLFDVGDLFDFGRVVQEWRQRGDSLNQSEAKAALQLKFTVELEIETETGATENFPAQFVWRFDPLAVPCELADDWSRLAEHPLMYCRVSRERFSGKGRTQSLDLFNVRTLRAAYGQARGSFVGAYKPVLDVGRHWDRNLGEALALGLVAPDAAEPLRAAFRAFVEKYSEAVRDFHSEGVAAAAAEAQLASYGQLLDALCRLAPGDRSRELLLRPVLQLGTVETDGGAPAAIVTPWHPIRLAAMRQKARRFAALVRHLLDGQGRFADPRLFFRDTLAELAHPVGPEVVLGWTGSKAELLAMTEVVGDYSLHELPVTGPADSETNENPLDAATRVAELVGRYLALHPHEQANLSVVLFNCDSAGLPVAVVGKLAALGDGDEGTRCQVVLRHRDSGRLRSLYEEIVEASDGDGDALVASETTRDFMARLRIGIMADQAPPPDPRDGCPEDIVFSQDVIARHASLGWFPVDARPLPEGALKPTQWSRRRPATRGDMRSVVYLCCPVQPESGWAYLTALASFLRGDWDGNGRVRYLPARQLDFRDPATARIVEETHNLAAWVANYDELLDRRQLLEQNVRVIRYKQSATPGRNLIVSSRAPLGLLRSMLLGKLRSLNLGLPDAEMAPLADRFIDVANGLSGDIVLRAAKRGRSASELMGLVLSQFLISHELGTESGAWFFLDDYADWLGAREEQIADLLVLTPSADSSGAPLLRVTVVETKFIAPSQLSQKRKESARQLRATLRRLGGALQAELPHLDRDLWLARLSDLLVDGARLSVSGTLDVGELRRAIREGTCGIELRGYSHVFLSAVLEGVDPSGCITVDDGGEADGEAFQEVFGRDLVRDLVLRFAANADPAPVRRASGSVLWSDPHAFRPERVAFLGGPSSPAPLRSAPQPTPPEPSDQAQAALTSDTPVRSRDGHNPAAAEEAGATPDLFQGGALRAWAGAGEIEVNADPEAAEWLRRAEAATRAALQQFQLQSRVLSATLTPNAGLLKFQGSEKLTVDQVLRRRSEFLTTHGLQLIGVQPEPGVVALSIARPQRQVVTLRSAWRRWAPNVVGGNQRLLIGIREDDGELLVLSPGQDHAPHTLIAGSTGSGKSVLMQDIILSIAATNRPDEAQIILIDPKQGVDYFAFEDLPHLTGGIIDRQDAALERIHALVEEMDERYGRLRAARAPNLKIYNERAAPGDRMPVMWLIHDEFAEWMMADEYKEEVTAAVGRLGVKARAAGIHLVFAAQRPEANVMPMQLRANLGNRLILRVDSEGTSEIALGEKGAERLLGRGHMMAKLEGGHGVVYAQVPYASAEELEEIVTVIRTQGSNGP